MNSLTKREQSIRLAMCLDTDGYIGIEKESRSSIHYRQRIEVRNTNMKLMNWLVENFGGTVAERKLDNPKWKNQYNWRLGGYKSCKLLKSIRPFLLLKGEQADLAIDLFEKVSRWRQGGDNLRLISKTDLAESLWGRCRALNRTGKKISTGESPKALGV